MGRRGKRAKGPTYVAAKGCVCKVNVNVRCKWCWGGRAYGMCKLAHPIKLLAPGPPFIQIRRGASGFVDGT